jgi:hypothetical protein
MSRFAVAVLIAAFAAVGTFATPSDAATKKKHPGGHATEVAVAAAPAPYGLPGSYYPAPPFPFFLLPGPWWLPAHP